MVLDHWLVILYGGAHVLNLHYFHVLNLQISMQVVTSKTKVKKTTVPVSELVHGGMTIGDLQKAIEQELEMALQDRIVEETKEKKNTVEAYIYDIRNKACVIILISFCLIKLCSRHNFLTMMFFGSMHFQNCKKCVAALVEFDL